MYFFRHPLSTATRDVDHIGVSQFPDRWRRIWQPWSSWIRFLSDTSPGEKKIEQIEDVPTERLEYIMDITSRELEGRSGSVLLYGSAAQNLQVCDHSNNTLRLKISPIRRKVNSSSYGRKGRLTAFFFSFFAWHSPIVFTVTWWQCRVIFEPEHNKTPEAGCVNIFILLLCFHSCLMSYIESRYIFSYGIRGDSPYMHMNLWPAR